MHVPFNRDQPIPLVDCGVIINAKEDLYEINFCQIMQFVGSLASRRQTISVNANMGDQVFADLHPCQRAVDGSY